MNSNQVIHNRNYRHSKKGLIALIYGHQKDKSKRRNHNAPEYSLNELRKWVLSKEIFHELYNNWVESEFDKSKTPSLNRKNNSIGYSFLNIEITTWENNDFQGKEDMRNGIIINTTNPQKAVVSTNQNTGETKEYVSARDAERKTGITQANISRCCKSIHFKCGGLTWKFKDKINGQQL